MIDFLLLIQWPAGLSCNACAASQVKVLIQHIEARQLLPPAVVLQALAPNSHLQLGVVKVSTAYYTPACSPLVTYAQFSDVVMCAHLMTF
jgi:hypothetical protein